MLLGLDIGGTKCAVIIGDNDGNVLDKKVIKTTSFTETYQKIFSLIKELILQIENGWIFQWIEFFYFDKLLMLGLIWLSVSFFYCVRRLVVTKPDEIEYSAFFKNARISFLIFYKKY